MSAPTETVADNRVLRIRKLHCELEAIGQRAKDKALEVGRLLAEQKACLKHGEWLPWCRANLDFSERTMNNYLSLYQRRDEIKSADFADLALSQAYRLLSQRNEKKTESKPNSVILDAEVVEDDPPAKKRTPHVSHNSGNNEWYTPPKFIDSARKVMGGIDLDPASCEIANKTVRADRFFTKACDGLKQTWTGRVWMNPPYAQPLIAQFAEAVSEKYESGEIDEAIVLVNNATETRWFQRMATTASAVCSLRSRVKFLDPDGNSRGTPPQGQAVLYFGNRSAHFSDEFERWGSIWRKPSVPEPEVDVVVDPEDEPSPDSPEPEEEPRLSVREASESEAYDTVLEALPKLTDEQRTQLGRILVTRWNIKIEEACHD